MTLSHFLDIDPAGYTPEPCKESVLPYTSTLWKRLEETQETLNVDSATTNRTIVTLRKYTNEVLQRDGDINFDDHEYCKGVKEV